jgi:ADP-ribose pyrophosphatase
MIVWEGKYIKVVKEGTWEYVSRTRGVTAAVILAMDGEHVILVEQYRVPLGAMSLELPAGLVGDEEEGEEIAAAAGRELEEETGYRAGRITDLGRFHSSPGMSSEGFNLLRAEELIKVGQGGGVGHEDIQVHRVRQEDVPAFVEAKRRQGARVDVKILLLLGSVFLQPLGASDR